MLAFDNWLPAPSDLPGLTGETQLGNSPCRSDTYRVLV